MADRKRKTVDKLTRIVEQTKNKEHILVSKIAGYTPDKTHQINLIADLTKKKVS